MYLVTGGSGFCGFEIVRYLLSRGERVRVLDIEPLPEPLSGVEFVCSDIRDREAVRKAVQGIDRIIHTVAKVPVSKAGREFWTVNVEGTRNVLAVAQEARVQKVVHLSSSAVQFSDASPVSEDAPYRPVGAYARSKRDAEQASLEFIEQGLNVDTIRPRTVIGAGRLGIFDILFDWISEGRRIYILGNGKNKIQFIHPEDLAACCYLASKNPKPSVFNVGGKKFGSLREDLGSLIRHAGSRSRIVSIPVAPAAALLATLDFFRLSPLSSLHYLTYHKDFYFTNERARSILRWEPHYGNQEILAMAYNDYVRRRPAGGFKQGESHRQGLKQGILSLLKKIS